MSIQEFNNIIENYKKTEDRKYISECIEILKGILHKYDDILKQYNLKPLCSNRYNPSIGYYEFMYELGGDDYILAWNDSQYTEIFHIEQMWLDDDYVEEFTRDCKLVKLLELTERKKHLEEQLIDVNNELYDLNKSNT